MYKLKSNDDYTPLWVKLIGGFIAASIGGIIGLCLAYHAIIWYINDCEPNPQCVGYSWFKQ